MTYGIICAMPEEFGILEKEIKNSEITKLYGRDFISGEINHSRVVAVVSRIGKVAAAFTTAILIERFKVDAVVFCGIAGGLGDNVKIGDIVVGSACVQHDFYLSDNDRFRIPLLNISNIPLDSALTDECLNACTRFCKDTNKSQELKEFFDKLNISYPQVHTGVIASGDQFISDNNKSQWIRQNIPNVQCVEMEGAAVAQACYEANVPCSVIRVISDSADNDADISFERFVNAASLYSCAILKKLLK